MIVMLSLFTINIWAVGSDEFIITSPGKDVISVELPVISEDDKSPFDFILDPHGLLYKTDAMRYGGGTVEEGATLLFYNKDTVYNYSRYSDKLTITNHGTVPVIVTISADISGLGEVELAEEDDFSESEVCSIYLAIVDNQGNIQPLSVDGNTAICMEMDFETYSFGLIGACNPKADWQDIYIKPIVTITWKVEPVQTETEMETKEKISADTIDDTEKETESLGAFEEDTSSNEKKHESETFFEEIPESSIENETIVETYFEESTEEMTEESTEKMTEESTEKLLEESMEELSEKSLGKEM